MIDSFRMSLAVALMLASQSVMAERVTVYTNATVPPLVIDEKIGLYPEMVAYLNQLKVAGLELSLETIPRKRLQVLLESGGLDGIVIGMMPKWVDDPMRVKYLWTEPFAYDRFVLVSSAKKPVYYGRTALKASVRMGVTLGYVYPRVDQWIARRKFIRDEAPTEERNLDKLVRGRVDAVIVSASILRYYTKRHGISTGFIIDTLPGPQTERRFLIPKSKQGVFEKLAPAIKKVNADPAWRRIQAQY
jgi:polar amino acid transport system substrate-binding protein